MRNDMDINGQTSSTFMSATPDGPQSSLPDHFQLRSRIILLCVLYLGQPLQKVLRVWWMYWESQSSVGTERLEPASFTPLSLFLPMSPDRAPLNRLLKHNRREAGRWKLYSGQGSLFNNSPTELDNASDKSTPLPKMLRSESVEYQAPLHSFCTFLASFSCSCRCNGLYNHTSVNPNTF